MNVLFGFGINSLLVSYDNQAFETRTNEIAIQSEILLKQIFSSGIETYSMKNSDKERENHIEELEEVANVLQGRIIIIGDDFEVLSDTYHRNVGQYVVTRRMVNAMNGKDLSPKKIGDSYVQVMRGIYNSESKKVEGVVIIIGSLEKVNVIHTFLMQQKAAVSGLLLLISAVFSFLVTYLMKRSFRMMQKDMDSIVAGHQDVRLNENGFREFNKLAVAFNRITDRYKELENTRQEFVSNVSHELKTPITSMKILADSLLMQNGAPVELYEEFMNDIVHEIDRENQIITDLLDLVKMDKAKADLNVAPTNINELLENLLKRITPIAEKRNITLHLSTMRQVIAEVDAGKLSLACNNLIENAVKYNHDGGKVEVSLNADHKFFYIRIKDNGVGIPEDCQDLIFERFYRVDKARSRETGGTGLGLAITRNVILLHKGSIRVHSKEGEGTTFTVRIPLSYLE